MKKNKMLITTVICFTVVAIALVLQTLNFAMIMSEISEEGAILSDHSAAGDGTLEIFEPLAPLSDALSEVEKYALEVVELVNAERAKAGAGALEGTGELFAAANVRAAELTKSFSHYRPDGSLCFTIFSECKIVSSARAENIAGNFKSPQQVVEAWMKSEGHRKNILNKTYKKIGVGVYKDSAGKLSWVQLFTD